MVFVVKELDRPPVGGKRSSGEAANQNKLEKPQHV